MRRSGYPTCPVLSLSFKRPLYIEGSESAFAERIEGFPNVRSVESVSANNHLLGIANAAAARLMPHKTYVASKDVTS